MDLLIVYLLMLVLTPLVNLAALRLRTFPLGYSPWNGLGNLIAGLLGHPRVPRVTESLPLGGKRNKKQKGPVELGPRSPLAVTPVIGWLLIKDEERAHGKRFWVRPFFLELLLPLLAVILYDWQVVDQRTVANPEGLPFAPIAVSSLIPVFIASLLLILFMTTASLIDLDEFEIPDAVILPGTLIAICCAALAPDALPPLWARVPPLQVRLTFVNVFTPNRWPDCLQLGDWRALAIGMGCVCLWSFALMNRVWRSSRGLKFAAILFLERLRRSSTTMFLMLVALAGSAGVWGVWQYGNPLNWQGLMTSLLGMTLGMMIIWVVRIVAALVLRKEAMGFGDVTLMGLIGAALGWQACVFVFFIAPFFALLPAIASAFSRRTTMQPIPYGPFLCLGAVVVIFAWKSIWEFSEPIFAQQWLLPSVLGLCVPVLAVLLGAWQVARYLLSRRAD